jgi:ABC-type molybdate transport system permease subunit
VIFLCILQLMFIILFDLVLVDQFHQHQVKEKVDLLHIQPLMYPPTVRGVGGFALPWGGTIPAKSIYEDIDV